MSADRLRQLFITLATIVFLAKYFVARGPTTSESHLVNLSSLELGVISFLFCVEVFFIRRAIDKKVVFAVAGYLFFFLGCLIHIYLSVEDFQFGYFIKATRLSGYVLVVLLFSLTYFEWPILRKYFILFTYVSIVFAICSKLFSPEYFSDVGYGFSRPRAFFSEPSTFAPVLAFGIYYALRIKSLLLMVASFLCTYFVASSTVYFVVVLVGVALILKLLFVGRGVGKILTALLLFSAIIFSLIFSPIIDQSLSGSFNYDRSKIAIQSVTNKGVGSSRLVSLFNYYEVLQRDGNLLFGKGLNSATTYFGEDGKLNENREYSILHSFFFSFGLLGIFLLLALLGGLLLVLMRSSSPDVYLFYCCFLFSSLINSSGGHTLYKFLYLFIFLVILRPGQLGISLNFKSPRTVDFPALQSS